MAARGAPGFPAPAFPEAQDQKLLGIYRQRDDSFVLQRVRVPGGRIRAEQLRALAEAALLAGARPALHLTTRQDIEIHGLRPETISALHRAIAATGLTTVGSAGDTVRNSTVDPLGGLVLGNVDLLPLALAIEAALAEMDGVWSLPRKFKISYSGDQSASMRPWFSDVGVIAHSDGHFAAVVAGSLGAKPGAGTLVGEALSATEVAALVAAAVRLHAEMGDREHRSRARLRHVRERLGDEGFGTALGRLWDEELAAARTALPVLGDRPLSGVTPTHLRLAVSRGDMPLEVVLQLADALSDARAELRIGIEHDLHVFGADVDALPPRVQAWASSRRIVACPGTALCSKAAGPTGGAATVLMEVAERNPELLFSLSGCPNSCSHAAAAHVGIVSRMKRVGDRRVPVFRVAVGGEAGSGPGLAEVVAMDVPLEALADEVEAALACGRAGQTATGCDRG